MLGTLNSQVSQKDLHKKMEAKKSKYLAQESAMHANIRKEMDRTEFLKKRQKEI